MNEETIKKLYIERPDSEVKLLTSYTTRHNGFLDILLSGQILSSKEVQNLIGNVKTHRGTSMTHGNTERYYDLNDCLSFSTGFVSFKYSNPEIENIKKYVGGLGIISTLENILKNPDLTFSHCSNKGGIKNFDLNRENIYSAVHKTRKSGELHDDGYGNLFEIIINPSNKNKQLNYPSIELSNELIIAIPHNKKEKIKNELIKRQDEYKKFMDYVGNKSHDELRFKVFEGRQLFYPEKTIPFIEKMTKLFDIDKLNIRWYNDKNLDIFLQRLAIN